MKNKLKNSSRLSRSLPFFIFTIAALCSAYIMNSVDAAFAFNAVPERTITLKEAYNLAARNNGTIKATKEGYYQSTLLKWSALSLLLPNVNLTYQDERMHADTPSSFSAAGLGSIFVFMYPNYEYSFKLNQPILKLGAIPAYSTAENTVKQEKMNLNDISSVTLYNVAVSYYKILNDISLINANNKTYNEAKFNLELSKAKLNAGLAIITDVLQAKSEFFAAKQDIISSKNSLKSDKSNLAALLGINRHFNVIKPAEPVVKKASLKTYILRSYKNNPALKSLKYAKNAANNQTQYYETQYAPQIEFTASYNALSEAHFIPGGSLNYWTAGAVLTMPLFQGGTRIISIEKARSSANAAMYNMIQAKRNLKALVVSDFYNIQNLKYELIALKQEDKFASKNYVLVEEEYKAGVATSVDVVTSLAQLISARHKFLSAKLSYYESVLELKKLTGSFQNRLINLTVDKFN